MAEFRFVLPVPPSANRYWRNYGGRVVVSDEARAYKGQAGWLAKEAGCGLLTGPVGVLLHVHRARRVGDLDNYIKVLLDALRGVVFEDDSQVVELHAFRGEDPAAPRVNVCVWAI
jgi:crossover junction endodeoxyribonuclease RusA